MPALFTFPNRIQFGPGARALLAEEPTRLGVARPLVVTDPGLLASGLVETVVAGLENVAVFDSVEANPTEANVLQGVERYREAGCDGVVGLGGGSPLDAAKAVRLMVSHPGCLADYDLTTGGLARIHAEMPPMAAIPTTAGTGTEAGR